MLWPYQCGVMVRIIGFRHIDNPLPLQHASINRIGAWVTGFRNVQKALLFALLQPTEELTKLQNEQDFTSLMIRAEELKTMPFGDVWAEYCKEQNVPADDMAWLSEIKKYENEVLLKR